MGSSTTMEKAVVAGIIAIMGLVIAGTVQVMIFEHNNPCMEHEETGRQICNSTCTGQPGDAFRHCWETCHPEKVCVSRQMADGTIQEKY